MPPAISVVLPAYRGAGLIRKSIESVLAQQGADYELLVCDDGSPDHTLAVVREFEGGRVRVLDNGVNRGLFPTLNRLIGESRAPLIRLWSQDDMMLPGCLEREVAFAEKHPQLGMWWCAVQVIDAHDAPIETAAPDATPEVVSPALAARIMWLHGSITGNIANVTLRREALERVGLFREDMKVSGDFEMWVRVSRDYPIGRIGQAGVALRRHGGQFSQHPDSAIKFIRENGEIYDQLLLRLPPAERAAARRERLRRADPQIVHQAATYAARGRLSAARDVLRELPVRRLVPASLLWATGLGRRLRARVHKPRS